MLWALRTKAIQMSATVPSAVSGRVTTLPARDFDVISGKRCPTIVFRIFSRSLFCPEVSFPGISCSDLIKLPLIRN